MSLWSISSSEDIMPLSILNICFASLGKLLSNPPSMNPTSYKMDIVITGMVLLVSLVGCEGSDPGETDLSPRYKQKVFDVFNKTFLYEGNHARWMKNQWNQENPSQKEFYQNKLYKDAWSVIDGKCEECKHQTGMSREESRRILSSIHKAVAKGMPQDRQLMHERLRKDNSKLHPVGEDLTWSLVHDWYKWYCTHAVHNRLCDWTKEMKATLLYIRDKLRNEGIESEKEMKKRWKLFYPFYRIKSSTLYQHMKVIGNSTFQPTGKMMEKIEAKYNRLSSSKKGRGEQVQLQENFNPYNVSHHDVGSSSSTHQHSYSDHPLGDEISASRGPFRPEPIGNLSAPLHFTQLLSGFKHTPDYSKHYSSIMSGHDTPTPRSTPRTPRRSDRQEEGGSSTTQRYYQPGHMQNLTNPIHYPPSFPEYRHTSGYESHHNPNVSRHGKEALPPTPRTARKSPLGEGGPSAIQQYQRSGFPQNLTDPIHHPPFPPEYGHTPGYEMHHYPDYSGHTRIDTGSPLSTPRIPRKSRLREGGSSTPQEYDQPGPTQNLTSSIHSSSMFPGYGYQPGYSMHHSPSVIGYDTGSPHSTPRAPHGSHLQEAHHDYQQPQLTQNLNAPIHSPPLSYEYGYSSVYGMPTFPTEPIFDPQTHSPRPRRRGEGSSTPKAQRRQPRE